MSKKRKVEVFTAGCPVCDDAVKLVNRIACGSCDVEVLDTRQPDFAKRAEGYGIQAVPSIVIDGKLAGCCVGKRIDEKSLRAEGIGVSLS